MREVSWDYHLARRLWDQGFSMPDIAVACKTSRNAIVGHKNRYWPARDKKVVAPKDPVLIHRAQPLAPGAHTLPPLISEGGQW